MFKPQVSSRAAARNGDAAPPWSGESAPFASTSPTRGDLAGLLRPGTYATRLKRRLDEFRHAHRVAQLERALARDPYDVSLWTSLAELHEAAGERQAVSKCYHRLAAIYGARDELDRVAFCYRKLEHLGCMEPAALHRQLAVLYAGARRHEEALRACRRVLEIYLAEGNRSAAIGYLRGMASLGTFTAGARQEFERLFNLPEGSCAAPPPRAAEALDAGDQDVVLRGILGQVTVLDIVRRVEDSALTGQLEVRRDVLLAHVYFNAGRIVAARVGGLTRREALRAVLAIDSGTYRVRHTERPAFDELKAPGNSTLLAEARRAAAETCAPAHALLRAEREKDRPVITRAAHEHM
jgi:tetratricopeptide (TPR) repeat protein